MNKKKMKSSRVRMEHRAGTSAAMKNNKPSKSKAIKKAHLNRRMGG